MRERYSLRGRLNSISIWYFAVGYYGYRGGVMVTASHNPAKYNGFKFCKEKAIPISGDTGIKDMEKIVNSGEYRKSDN